MATFDDVARLATPLPEVIEADRRGTRTWAVRGRVFAWERPFSKADITRFGEAGPPAGPILAIRTADLGEKDAILAGNPAAFFTIPHFDGFAAVLVRLDEVTGDDLREAIIDGWFARAPPKLAGDYTRR